MKRHHVWPALVATALSCATNKPVAEKSSEPTRSVRCWGGQLTKVGNSGYQIASVPMLLRIERDPSRSRMVREMSLGDPAVVSRDVMHVKKDGTLSFVESDVEASQYRADGDTSGEPWSGDAVNLDLVVPTQSVRVREWSDKDILYGHYRYRDGDGEYGDERFHALSALSPSECRDRMEQAKKGQVEPDPRVPEYAIRPAISPATVALKFDWPANMDATIRTRIERSGTRSSAPSSVDATYQLRTTPSQDGMRIVTRSRELLAMPSHTLDDKDRWERATVLASLFPAVLVGDDANVSELAESGDYLDIVRTAYLERWGGGKDTKDKDVLAYVDQNLSAELAKVSAQRYWNPLVAFWAGAEMTIGKPEEVSLTRALYVPGAYKPIVVQIPTTYAVEGWVPCQAGESAFKCVKLVSSYSVNEWDIRNQLTDAGKDGKPIRVMRHVDQTHTVLIADPKTLLPYHYYEERELDSSMGDATKLHEVRRREVMDMTFEY